MRIKTGFSVYIHKESSIYETIPRIMSSKMLLGYTDEALDRRYTIGKQYFSTDLLWDRVREVRAQQKTES